MSGRGCGGLQPGFCVPCTTSPNRDTPYTRRVSGYPSITQEISQRIHTLCAFVECISHARTISVFTATEASQTAACLDQGVFPFYSVACLVPPASVSAAPARMYTHRMAPACSACGTPISFYGVPVDAGSANSSIISGIDPASSSSGGLSTPVWPVAASPAGPGISGPSLYYQSSPPAYTVLLPSTQRCF